MYAHFHFPCYERRVLLKEYFIAATVVTGAAVVVKDYVLPKLQGKLSLRVCAHAACLDSFVSGMHFF